MLKSRQWTPAIFKGARNENKGAYNSRPKTYYKEKQITLLPHRFHVDLPDDLTTQVEKCRDNSQVRQIGIEWCIEQSRELINAGVPVLHYYSMGKSTNIQKTASEIFSSGKNGNVLDL